MQALCRGVLRYIELKSGYSGNGPAWIGQGNPHLTLAIPNHGVAVYANVRLWRMLT